MDQLDQELKNRAAQEPFDLPAGYAERVKATLDALKGEKRRRSHRAARWLGCAVAAALAVFVAMPNLSAPVAHAMAEVPVLGAIVRVITLRNYTYDDGGRSAKVQMPQIQGAGTAGGEINEQVRQDVDRLIAQFEADCAADGTAYRNLDVSYCVVTDTQDWFTLRINAVENTGSSVEILRFYHIDKKTGRVAALGDLFPEGTDYVAALSEEVRSQMEAREGQAGETFFPELFTEVDEDQNFYWNEDGALTLVFDEGSIAPNSMGNPEFVIPQEVIDALQ